jgi:hypothetical protein
MVMESETMIGSVIGTLLAISCFHEMTDPPVSEHLSPF